MRRLTLLFCAFAAAIVLSSCSEGMVMSSSEERGEKLPSTGTTWTVLVYMCGGNEEEESGRASQKLDEMMRVDYPENINVAVQTGGSSTWHKKGIYSDYSQRFEVRNGAMYLADQSLAANMGDYRTLTDFIKWGTSHYKSDRYMLVMSGAGGGAVKGMAYDAIHDNDSLNLEEISYAISLSGINFDIIGFDSSLMCSLETASALSTCSDYMVASQEIQSSVGWDYEGFLSFLCENPSASVSNICRSVCDTYYTKSLRSDENYDATMAVIDMSKISTLSQAFDGMAGDMLTAAESVESCGRITGTMDAVTSYGGSTVDEGISNLKDLGDMAVKLYDYVGNTADMLVMALNDAVEYRVCGERCSGASGMSVYYPSYTTGDELQEYMEIPSSNKYKEFLKKICIDCTVNDSESGPDYTASGAWVNYSNDMAWLEYKSILENNTYELNILGNMNLFKSISVNIYKKEKKADRYVYLGKDEMVYTADNYTGWESGIFSGNFSGKLMRLYGKPITMRFAKRYSDREGVPYEVYSIPVILNGERSNVRVQRNLIDDSYDILGAWSGLDAYGAARSGVKKVGFFDRIAPLYAAVDEEHNVTEYVTGSTWFKTLSAMSRCNVENGEYMLEFELTDIYGHKRYGTQVSGSIYGGKMTLN